MADLKSCADAFIAEVRSAGQTRASVPTWPVPKADNRLPQQIMNSRAEFQVSPGKWL